MRVFGVLRPTQLAIALILNFSFVTASHAVCTGVDILANLQRYGIAAEVIKDNSDTYDLVEIFRDGDGTWIYVEEDGDMTFREWYGKSFKPSVTKANEINRKFKFVSANFDKDGDLEISYYVRNFENGCTSFARNHARTWWELEDLVEEYLRDNK